jgi:hypothetical protein
VTTPGASTLPAACLNCGAPFRPERRAFCPECGQETSPKPPGLRELAQQFGGAYVSTEGALWRTLTLLLTRPGELTAQYLAGRRKHFVQPLRLYLTVSVLVLLLARLTGGAGPVAGVDNPQMTASLQSATPSVRLNFFGPAVGLKDGVFFCDGLPAPVCQRFRTVIQTDPPAFGVKLRAVNDRVVGNWGLVMFLLLPVFTLGLKVIYRNRRLAYTEHLVHALHLHTFWFCVLAVMLVRVTWVSQAGLLLMAVYTLIAGRRVYGGRWGPRLVRGLTLAAFYTLLMGLAVPLTLLVALLA